MPAFTLSNPEQTHALGNASTHSLAWAAAIDNPREDNTGPSKLQDFLSQTSLHPFASFIMSPNKSYKTGEAFNTALGAGLRSTWAGADAIHGAVNAGVKIQGAVAEHKWTKARVNEQLQRAQHPDGKPRVDHSAQYQAANPTLSNLGNDKNLYNRVNGR
ncbi:hypothetical protein OAory_01112490 [Aspergillus oryzae]|uniref:Uncharacterized protein n=1 Tax=Aspergillus oryzae TaxID=5062 RepID=A0A1S9D727_ASPOZ|nr:hypothetical protein OAory_01112490 [Aspergillus oryzae]